MDRIEFSKIRSNLNRAVKFKKCLHPQQENCSKKVIKAHSIQNNRILNKLSKDGYVLHVDISDLKFTQDLSKIGKKIATTFEGFCDTHDKVFTPIEAKDYDPTNVEQNFFFAYRIFCREYIVKNQAYELIEETNREFGENNDLISMLEGYKHSFKDLKYYKLVFDKALMEKDYDKIGTKVIELSNVFSIAVCSGFGIEFDFKGNRLNELSNFDERLRYLFLTIFPQNNSTYCLLSYLKEDEEFFALILEQLGNMGEEMKIQKLNILIVEYCENFVYSPEQWGKIPREDKAEFLNLFQEIFAEKKPSTMIRQPKFNLFC